MSQSQHPVALRIERRVGGATRLLATVMCLPLLDGIFPALVLAGALSEPTGILEVGLLIFGGSATVAVVLADMDGSPREQARSVLLVGSVVVVGAVVEAALAPTIAGFIDLGVFKRFAGLVILAVAAQTASARVGDLLPRPAIIIALGLVASLDPAGAALVVQFDPGLMLRAAAAALVAVGFALHLAVFGPWLRDIVDIDRFRFGSAVALGVLPLGLFGLVPGDAPLALAVLGMTFLFAFDPQDSVADLRSDDGSDGGDQSRADDEYDSVGPASPDTVAEEDHAPWL
ncbi:DUF5794 domain-containing protein [Halorientalis sp.]|jgi:hypothetical protein|uniref:DUF5794 domain-containing protein n=1 Tax=Halorientalis sp. TaxID=1931229 RepID=UPI00261DEE1D|nr:DUF5794 domain-containing protein [Halorientalis sp.]